MINLRSRLLYEHIFLPLRVVEGLKVKFKSPTLVGKKLCTVFEYALWWNWESTRISSNMFDTLALAYAMKNTIIGTLGFSCCRNDPSKNQEVKRREKVKYPWFTGSHCVVKINGINILFPFKLETFNLQLWIFVIKEKIG